VSNQILFNTNNILRKAAGHRGKAGCEARPDGFPQTSAVADM
jgi:hypothetical protein